MGKKRRKPPKQTKKENKLIANNNASDDDDCYYLVGLDYLVGLELFSNSLPNEQWVQCLDCKKWSHVKCTKNYSYYICFVIIASLSSNLNLMKIDLIVTLKYIIISKRILFFFCYYCEKNNFNFRVFYLLFCK